jgi:hypothetical protein
MGDVNFTRSPIVAFALFYAFAFALFYAFANQIIANGFYRP